MNPLCQQMDPLCVSRLKQALSSQVQSVHTDTLVLFGPPKDSSSLHTVMTCRERWQMQSRRQQHEWLRYRSFELIWQKFRWVVGSGGL